MGCSSLLLLVVLHRMATMWIRLGERRFNTIQAVSPRGQSSWVIVSSHVAGCSWSKFVTWIFQ
jgi:hypothetical protein